MSKLLVALMMLSIAYARRGLWCSLDKCKSKDKGVKYQSFCGPSHLFYVCGNAVARYSWCSRPEFCVIDGRCSRCGDTCEKKPDGKYPSLNRPRPYYYCCESGELYYRECEPNQSFNPWTKRCECFEGACKEGDGWRPSFCRGKGWRVMCLGGFPRYYERCPPPRPDVDCRTYQCVASCRVYSRYSSCCYS